MPGRFAKDLIAALCALLLAAAFPALAQQGGKRVGPGGPGKQRPPQQVPASDAGPQHREVHFEGRMTPEQRRQLRRDVHDHGRDIYHRDRPRPERQ
jgi:hypothetical protein